MKNKTLKRLLCGITTGMLIIGSLTGCGNTAPTEPAARETVQQTESAAEQQTEAESTAAAEETAQAESAGITYPIEEQGVTLTMAVVEEAAVTANAKDISETPFGKAWQEQTGVTLEIQQMADGEAMSLLFAGGDLPDIIYYNFDSYSGGPSKAIKDKIIEPLNDYMEYAPDLQAVLEGNDLYRKSCTTQDGLVIGFPFIRGADRLRTSMGFVIRQDWLDDLNLEVPRTPDDLYTVLKAFQEEKGAEVPFTVGNWALRDIAVGHGAITSPFGLVKANFYQKDGTVHYGYAEAEYKDVLTYLNKLYAEGLLDPNFASLDGNTKAANMMNGNAGLIYGSAGGDLGTYLNTMKDSDPDYNLTGFGPLVAKAGDKALSTQYDNATKGYYAIITPGCKNKEAAVKFLNYGYTEAGHMLFNFGIEGESYTMEGDYPTYTDLILNNPDGLTKQQALAQYTRAWMDGPMVQDKRYSEQYSSLPQQQAALECWSTSDAALYNMPPVTIADADSAEYSRIMSDINTYVSEMFVKYVSGLESLDTFETDYLPTLESLGVNRAIELQQAALDEFNAR